jgi:hypothetical protein
LVLAASLFSTTGVLPFTPNLVYFIYVLLVLAILVVATLVALFNWQAWLQLVVDCIWKRPGGEETYLGREYSTNGLEKKILTEDIYRG